MKKALGIDIGGTKLAIALINERGMVIAKSEVHDHIDKLEDDLVNHIYNLSKELMKENNTDIAEICGVGVCFPGHVRFNDGTTITTSNLKGFKNYPLKSKLEKLFGLEVIVDNDANCQGYAEYKFGSGQGYDDVIFITVSTGIGGGIILNNKLYRGMTGTAGEFGHMIIDHSGEANCTCDNNGCWMACSCGLFLNRTAKKHLESGVKSSVISLDDVNRGRLDGRLIKKGLDSGDELCKTVISEFADYIAVGVYNIFQIFNPPVVVLGGGLMKLGNVFLEEIKYNFRKLAGGMMHDNMQIVISELEGNAGVIGAALLAIDENV